MDNEPQNKSVGQESNIGKVFSNGRNPVFAFIFDNCKTQWLKDKNLFTANITMCGYDYFALADNEMDAKLDLCLMLMQSRYILNNFKK